MHREFYCGSALATTFEVTPAALADNKQTGALLVSVEEVSQSIRCCNIYETLYQTVMQGKAALADIERSLSTQVSGTAMRFSAKRGLVQTAQAILHPDEVEIVTRRLRRVGDSARHLRWELPTYQAAICHPRKRCAGAGTAGQAA